MTDTTNIRNAIKGLPEGSLLSASFDERYQVVGTTDDLKALVAENESLKERLNDIDSGMSFDEYRAKCFPNGFERDGGNDD
jgi:hypothetical protein